MSGNGNGVTPPEPANGARVGVLGGSFDPIHIGHLILAEEAREQLGLSCVYFVPAGEPPHKRDRRLTPVEDRVQMTRLAIAGNSGFELSRADADRPGPHYTVDLVHILKAQLPAAAELYFLMGFDSLADLPKWYRPAELLAACRLVALTRPNIALDWAALDARLPGIRDRVTLLDMPELEIASNDLRARIRAGRSIRYFVPDPVCAYIYDKGLYRGATGNE
jgi:nicotinate-nucleotide adenylyltransferase